MAERKEWVTYAMKSYELSERHACQLFQVSRTVYRYQPIKKDDGVVRELLNRLAESKPRWGFKKMFHWIRNQGHGWNHKRVRRIYRELNLNLRIKPKKRFPKRDPTPLVQPQAANQSWSVDFMSDALSSGRSFRTFNVIDDFNREALWIEVDTSLPAARVIRVLENLAAWRGYPDSIRMDNGPEFISGLLERWADEHHVQLNFIQPGKPAQNGYIERFNRTYRTEVLDMYIFKTLGEVRALTDEWLEEYNTVRPHQALNGLTPQTYTKQRMIHERADVSDEISFDLNESLPLTSSTTA